MSKKQNGPREWFAVKRTKHSKSYQFYEPNINNEKMINEIAPESGNYEVVTLIEKSYADELEQKLQVELEIRKSLSRRIEFLEQKLQVASSALDEISDFRNPPSDMATAQYFLEIRGIARDARHKLATLKPKGDEQRYTNEELLQIEEEAYANKDTLKHIKLKGDE